MVRNCALSTRMEPTFYEEHSFNNVNQMKRQNLTLDLNSARGMMKKQKFNNGTPLLSTPDLNMLKVGTPELEKFIMNGSVTTATPTSTQILFPRVVTEEQEDYARGFVDALTELHNSDSSQPADLHAPTYTNLDLQHPNSATATSTAGLYGGVVHVKDEPQTVPSMGSTPPLSPIDMENQERIKLERKRQRNRVAASKCRRRKLERISRLEDKVKMLKGENTDLSGVVNRLKEQVCILKEQVMQHVSSGCQIMPQAF